jgi:hypothetical protein
MMRWPCHAPKDDMCHACTKIKVLLPTVPVPEAAWIGEFETLRPMDNADKAQAGTLHSARGHHATSTSL